MAIKVKAADLKRAEIVIPGWYVIDIKGMEPKPAKSDGSTNFNYKIEIVSDKAGSVEYAGTPTKDFLINEKGLFTSGINFLKACGLKQEDVDAIKRGGGDIEIDENAPVGKRILAKIINTEYNGRTSNECADFLPIEAAA